MPDVKIGNVTFGNKLPLSLIAGPCQLESRDHALMMAEALKTITDKLGIGFVFKASFDKANRTSADSPRGAGIYQAVKTFREIKAMGIPTLTDIHENWQVEEIALAVDCLQIPALLCRQTNLLKVAAMSRMPINVKKGQFTNAQTMLNAVEKIYAFGGKDVLLTERGNTWGYGDIVVDMRNLEWLRGRGSPVIFDATHSVQTPGGKEYGKSSGGWRNMAPILARAATATGIAGIFIEVHNDPDNAPSDGPCMTKLSDMEELLKRLMAIDHVTKTYR